MVHANIHSAHQGILDSTYKNSFLHTKAYYKVHTNIHFTHHSISHGTRKMFILHTKVYHHGRVKLRLYKTQANSNICRACTIFHIVCSSKVLQDEHKGSCIGTTFSIHVLVEHEIWLPQGNRLVKLLVYTHWSQTLV